MTASTEYHTSGVLQLTFGVVAQAVEDYKKLESYGIVKDGEVTGYWPSIRNSKGKIVSRKVVGMTTIADAVQLVYFLKSEMCSKAMSHLSNGVSSSRIREQLGFKKEATR